MTTETIEVGKITKYRKKMGIPYNDRYQHDRFVPGLRGKLNEIIEMEDD